MDQENPDTKLVNLLVKKFSNNQIIDHELLQKINVITDEEAQQLLA